MSITDISLHIGGTQSKPGWTIVDIEPRPEVGLVCDARYLPYPPNSVSQIYASHVLEHFHYGLNDELLNVLKSWHRVLKPGGKLSISVPNLFVLCQLYIDHRLKPTDRIAIMRVMFGGQLNNHDVHKAGLDQDILAMYCEAAGFATYQVVPAFGLFNDCSELKILGRRISVNAIVIK